MTIQQLAGSSGKGSNSIAAMLGTDENAAPAPNADFTAALRHSMAQADKPANTDTSVPAATPPPGELPKDQPGELLAVGLPAAQAEVQDSSETTPSVPAELFSVSPPPAPPPLVAEPPVSAQLEDAQLDAQLDTHSQQAQQDIPARPGIEPRPVKAAVPDGTPVDKVADPLLSPMFTSTDLRSAANDPNAGSAFTHGLPYLINLVRESTSAATTMQADAAASPALGGLRTDSTAGTPARTLGAGLLVQHPHTGKTQPGGTALPQLAGAHAQTTATHMSADNLLEQFASTAADTALPEVGVPRSGSEPAAPPGPQTQGLVTLQTNIGSARDPRPLTTEAAPTPTPQFPATTTMGSDAWVQDLGTRIEWLQDMKLSKAELFLHPEELGALEISIMSENDTTSVAFVTQTAAAREIIESTLPRLKEMLASHGLQLEQSHVSQQSAEGHKHGKAQGELRNTLTDSADRLAESESVRHGSRLLPSGQIDHYV